KSLSKRAGLTRLICYNDTDSNVRITTPVPQLTEVTFCLWMRSTSTNDGTMVSYAVPNNHNEMILLDSKNIRFLINAVSRTTNVDAVNDGVCHYICFTWTSVTGRWQIFVDGVLVDSGTVSKGTPIQGGGVLVLGQDQDVVGGGFDPFQAFVGKMTNFNLWNRVLTNQEIIENLDNGNIYSWDISNLLMQGTETIRNEDICTGAVTCDPHFTTLDGRHYSHQGVCWYTL
uniref:Pentraxin family member n=1 Tax=Saccoglossus kowalevskii TaxID=10224 RepID=A0ABM0GWW2_SACKO